MCHYCYIFSLSRKEMREARLIKDYEKVFHSEFLPDDYSAQSIGGLV